MPDCCAYEQEFSARVATADLRRFRKRGLDRLEARVADYLGAEEVAGRSVLEVGGGIGVLQVALLKKGAGKVTNVEMSSAYESVARELLAEEGFGDRVTRLIADFAVSGEKAPSSDIVLLNRVICCYPDMPLLLGAALGKARKLAVLTFPRRRASVRFVWAADNLLARITRRAFRGYLHAPEEVLGLAESHGFAVAANDLSPMWHTVVLRRRRDTGVWNLS
jgi:2-polyprenyl-3-methyl-5-hydroxy-6-metoxy-1,4-benzoquinol methylase